MCTASLVVNRPFNCGFAVNFFSISPPGQGPFRVRGTPDVSRRGLAIGGTLKRPAGRGSLATCGPAWASCHGWSAAPRTSGSGGMNMAIRTPIAWGADQCRLAGLAFRSASDDVHRTEGDARYPLPAVRRIGAADLKDVLAKGLGDFGANRTDVIFLCVFYPLVGLVLQRLAAGYEMLPLLFPLASGFA